MGSIRLPFDFSCLILLSNPFQLIVAESFRAGILCYFTGICSRI